MPATLRSFDYHKTFLHQHIDHQRYRTDDVLALEHILKRTANAWADYQVRNSGAPGVDGHEIEGFRQKLVRDFDLLDAFFYSEKRYADQQTYFPVQIRESQNIFAAAKPSLSNLLAELHQRQEKKGVLLSTRSGAGKTVAALRSYFDTLHHSRDLAGFLPIWLRFSEASSDFAHLLWNSAELAGRCDPKRLSQWIHYSPPILLFVDLNGAPDELRSNLARETARFQTEYQGRGHRVIVAYRSSASRDPVFTDLGRSTFDEYDLIPIEPKTAIKYVTNIGEFESGLVLQMKELARPSTADPTRIPDPAYEFSLHLAATPKSTPEEFAKIESFINRYAEKGKESIVSTPLIMHLCSIIPLEKLSAINAPSDLYHHVVDEQINVDVTYGRHQDLVEELKGHDLARPRILGVLGRTAIKILTSSLVTTNTRVSKDEFDRTLDPREPTPKWKSAADDLRDRVKNLPLDFENDNNHYAWPGWLKDPQDSVQYSKQLAELTPIRRDGDLYGFIHDSFVYYFAARLLREWQGPGRKPKLDEDWYASVAKLFTSDPERWFLVSEFLAEQLSDDELKELLGEIAATGIGVGAAQLLLRLGRSKSASSSSERVFSGLVDMVRRQQQAYRRHPTILFQDVYHYSRDVAGIDEADPWMRMIRRRYESKGKVWFRSVCGTKWLPSRYSHTEGVIAVAIMFDGRTVSASAHGTVVIWNEEMGETINLTELNSEVMGGARVSCLAVAKEAPIVFWGDYRGRLWRWMQDHPSTVQGPLIKHICPVSSISCSADGRVMVCSGWGDNVVYRRTDGNDPGALPWTDLEEHKRFPYIEHSATVQSVAVSADGQVVVSGGNDSVSHRRTDGNEADAPPWKDLEKEKKSPYMKHGGEVRSVATSSDGRVVVSGGEDGVVHRRTDGNDADAPPWKDLEDKKKSPYIVHRSWVRSVATSSDGAVVVSGGGDGISHRRTDGNEADAPPWEDLEKEKRSPYMKHGGEVRSVTTSSDGAVVVSGGNDDVCHRRTDGNDADAPPWEDLEDRKKSPYIVHGGSVWSVTCSSEGRLVASGGKDGLVHRRTDGNDNNAGPWVDLLHEMSPFIKHSYSVHSVACSREGKVVVSGGGRVVYRRTDGNEPKVISWKDLCEERKLPYIEHSRTVWSVACSADGDVIVSGGGDNIVYRRTDGRNTGAECWTEFVKGSQENAAPYIKHEDWVSSVACSECGQVVVSGGGDNVVHRRIDGNVKIAPPWEFLTLKSMSPFIKDVGSIFSLACSSDGEVVLSGGKEYVVLRRNESKERTPVSWEELSYLKKLPYLVHQDSVFSVACSCDGRVVFSAGKDQVIYRRTDRDRENVVQWADLDESQCYPFMKHENCVNSVCCSMNGQLMVSGGEDSLVQLVMQDTADFRKGQIVQVALFTSPVAAVSMPKDLVNHPRIVVGTEDGSVHLLDVEPWATQRRQEQAALSKDAM